MPGLDGYLRDWRPEPLTESETLSPTAAQALAAVLECPDEVFKDGTPLPALWHWVHFQHWPSHGELGADGHPAHGHFLPPLPDRRRMFAGGRVRTLAPLLLGQYTEKSSSLAEATVKQGRSGELVFVTVRSEFRQEGQLRLVEEQDYVYRSGESAAKTAAPQEDRPSIQPESGSAWGRSFTADSVRLFRFSALTANAHRIHYDRPYARDVEAYPDLVVHGPLLTLLMTELARKNMPGKPISNVDYRFHRPVFAGDPIFVTGDPAETWSANMAVLGTPDQVLAEAKVTCKP